MSTTRRVHFLPSRSEIIASAALGTLPKATSNVCGICRDEEKAPTYDPCGHNHGFCADCLINWMNDFDNEGKYRDFCPYCRTVICQAERNRDITMRNIGEEDMDVEGENDDDDEAGDSDAESDMASIASDVDTQLERLDRFMQGADDDIRRFWWWLRQVLAVILGMRVLAWYGVWAPPNH